MSNQRLRLFSEVYELGYVAVVYDVNGKREVARRDSDDLEDGKKKAEESAADYLRQQNAPAQLSSVTWQMTAQTRLRQPRR